ncbi:MAG: N-acetylmuramoyl-L-alanine amidase [Bacteroidales bacterium]|nr:N-acetylmuramoyl-L-alanine amidase [Bacteroidales bacterium]
MSYAQVDNKTLVRMVQGPHWYNTNDSVYVADVQITDNQVVVYFNDFAQTVLVDKEKLAAMTDSVRHWLKKPSAKVSFFANAKNLTTLLPQSWPNKRSDTSVVVRRYTDIGLKPNMTGLNIALWNSHGRYYEKKKKRWQWQRARLFTTVEDMLTAGFVLQFLEPMLSNAGAYVLMPRERDIQSNMYVADNEKDMTIVGSPRKLLQQTGYKHFEKITGNVNPFAQGTAVAYQLTTADTVRFTKKIDKEGDYAVYVCYCQSADNSDAVTYTVRHAGGMATYVVNQRKGGSMWIYLGNHHFTPSAPCVVDITANGRVSADAVRIGGGKGRVVRGGYTSKRPAWMEAARYYLQADGFGADKVYSLSKGARDYTDDINCRGEWVNALQSDKNIKVDAVLALHTDAGIAQCDTTIGTLTIVTTNGNAKYTDGRARKISRDMAQTLEQSVIGDIRATWNPTWSARGIWDKGYSESRRADAPSVLMELLSHQNLNDVRFALHPKFRFDACRAIYKGLLRFLCGQDAVIQPLPVVDFGIARVARDTVSLSWQPAVDALEPTAKPSVYLVYANGRKVAQTDATEVKLQQSCDGQIVDYYIVACNEGGLSFPSQTLSASLQADANAPSALLVEGFDRLASPSVVSTPEWAGLITDLEPGVAWGADFITSGAQYDFDPQSPWTDDDSPGWGASFADNEGKIIVGSLRKQTSRDARRLHEKGYSFVSVSKPYFEKNKFSTKYDYVHISLGNERSTWYGAMPERHAIYTAGFLNKVKSVATNTKEMLITGAYIGSDIPTDSVATQVADVLGFTFRSAFASRTRVIVSGDTRTVLPQSPTDEGFAPSVNAIEPANDKAYTLYRYEDSGASAAVKYGNITVCGFSF